MVAGMRWVLVAVVAVGLGIGSAVPAGAALIGVANIEVSGGANFPALPGFPSPGTGAGFFLCVASGPDDCDIFDTGAPLFGETHGTGYLQITGNGVFVQSPIDPVAPDLLTNGLPDFVSWHQSACSSAPSGPGLCVGSAGSGFGTSELSFFGNDGDDPGLALSGVDFAGWDLTHIELEISNYVYQATQLGAGTLVSYAFDAEIRLHGELSSHPIPEPSAALVFAAGLAFVSRSLRPNR